LAVLEATSSVFQGAMYLNGPVWRIELTPSSGPS